MNTMLKRIVSMFLCFVLVAGYLPAGALAAETEETVVTAAAEATNAPSVVELSDEATVVVEEEAAEAEENEEESLTADTGDPEEAVSEENTSEEAPAEEETSDEVTSDEETSEEEITEEETSEEATEEAAAFVLEAAPVDVSLLDAPGDSVVVIAGSDYQNNGTDPKSNTQKILTAIQKDYATANGFIFGGDYSQTINKNPDTTKGINELKGVVEGIYGTGLNEVFVQGNHDAAVIALTATGAHDTDDYGVFSINEDDFSSSHSGSSVASTTMLTALETYLNEKVNAGYSKPVFVATHLPLHATSRGDNTSATKIFNLLNAAGASGLNIIFLFGHNHSGGYDAYLGNGSIYLPKGSSIPVAGGSNSTLNFTYMNYGYVGYVGGNACTHLTMTTFEISDTQVIVKRYDANGEHTCGSTAKVLKAAGVASGSYAADTTVVNSGATITLTTPTGGSGDSGDDNTGTDTPTTPDTPASGNVYTLVDTMVDGGEYLIVSSNADGDAYAMKNPGGSSSGANMGATPVTIENGTITIDDTDVIWKATANGDRFNLTNGTDYLEGKSGKVNIFSAQQYATRGWNYEGNQLKHTGGDNTYVVYYSNGFTYTYNSTSEKLYIFQRTSNTGSGGGSTVTPEGGDWVTISSGVGGTIYTLDTDGVSAGEDYLIVSTGTNGDGFALANKSGEVGKTAVTINDGKIIVDDTNLAWTFTKSSGTYVINNGDTYIHPTRNGGLLGDAEHVTVAANGANTGRYNLTRQSSYGNTTYYVTYSSDAFTTVTSSSSNNGVYLFRKTGTQAAGDAEYAKLDGELTYTVARGASDEDAKAAVKAGINVLTSASADGSNPTTLDDEDNKIEWALASNYDGNIPGEYAVTISYKGVTLGTAKVVVPEVTINGISVNPASGVVTVGASEAALVGATVTVDVADGEGEDFTVPVTVSMLKGDFDTSIAGTYPGLTVSYNGFTFTGFTLTVKEKVVNNYPSYPNEGAVKVDKKAHGVDFQKTGVAQVELTTSGVPMNQGVDVVLILDTSSSMNTELAMLNNRTRIDVLKECVDALIVNLKAPRPDGSESDIDIAIADFAGYLLGHDGTKLNNYIGSQVKETDADKVGAVLTNGWVDVQSLPDNWGTANIKAKSGTNYDHGLEMAYNLLAQKQADNGDKTRKQFVMFLSDGAPLQYNGVNSNSLGDDWEQWILGSYSTADVNKIGTIKNKDFYYGNNGGNGQKHWVAEAIKGSPDQEYSIVYHENYTYGAATMGTKAVSGLGATIYSVGLALEKTNMPTDEVGQAAILSTLASSPELSTAVTTPNGLQEFFDDFAGAVLYAAENAVFEDQMGPNFNIQLASTTKRLVDGKEFTLNPAPTIEVREYTIWTRDELEDANGTLSEENAKKVGTRKTDASGNYIYNTLEVVRFNAEGTKAYSNKINIDNDNVVGWSTGTDGKITLDEGDNILNEGIISAKTFWYNNGTTTVKVDVDGNGTAETDLAPETFIWKVGTIKTTELALSYYVYLDESLEGDASAGSYDTNTYAILTYDNYLGNPCQKETISPQLAWLSANVSYAYYLVNKDGVPVNANGEEVTFANREIIVHPTKYGEIKLNTIEDVENLKVASTGVLDEGNYALFDYDAEYLLSVNSDATGGWTIKVGNGKPATTYVTGFSSTQPFTNATSSDSDTDNYDYTHTTVWFAVVWEPDALDDTVVVDYGLPVDVHVLTNDFFGDFGELIGVANDAVTDSDGNIRTNEIPASTDPVAGNYGSALVRKPDTGANESNSVIRYELNSMEMKEPEVFTYSVEYTNTKLQTHNGFYYGTLTVIPATTIYYEDEFVTLTSETKGTDGNWTNDTPAAWTPVGTEVDATQAEDRPGDINFAFDTVIDANNVYGYDSAYSSMSQYSLGSAAKANVYSGHRAKATFEFYGTGFDVISLTSNKTGTIVVSAYPWDADKNAYSTDATQSYAVDTYYGYTRNADGEWVVDTNDSDNALYQVPVMKISSLPYGKYKAEIVAAYSTMFDHDQYANDSYDFYLDAIRIYDPANNGAGNQVVENAYKADGEGWPTYYEVRNKIIDANTFESVGTDPVNGIVFIDGVRNNASVSDYTSYGPNNETYLAAGQAIAFELSEDSVEKIQLAVKTVGGSASIKVYSTDNVTALDQEINTATDMYYDITAMNGKNVVIMNDGESGILSITNVKITHTAAPNSGAKFLISRPAVNAVLATMNVEEEVPETTEPSVPETTEPEETKPVKPDNSELKAAVEEAKKIKQKGHTRDSFKKLQTAIKAAEKVLKNRKATQAQIDKALADLNAAVDGLETVAVNPIKPKPGGSGGKIHNHFQAQSSIADVFKNLLKGNKK